MAATAHGRTCRLTAAALAAAVAACSTPEVTSTQVPAGLACVDDSSHCVGQRTRVFDTYMADKSRAWVKQPASANSYASGVRLMALSKRRRDLSCDELAHGRREADGAAPTLRGNAGRHLTPAQVSRGVMLSHEVSRELQREMDKRCRRA